MRDPPQILTTLSEAERALAMKHFSILQPVLEEGVSQTEVARLHHIPLRTLQRWMSQYRQRGLVGLARQERSDRGSRRGLEAPLVPLIEGAGLAETETLRCCHSPAGEQDCPRAGVETAKL